MENHARYGEMIYSHEGDEVLYVNMFIPSVLNWGKTVIKQENRFPEQEGTTITVNPKKATEFTICIRIPEWTSGKASATVNGEKAVGEIKNGYLRMTRRWEKGDKIDVSLPMSLRAVQLPDKSENYSFMYGPVVLAAETGRQEQLGMYADDSRGGHIAYGKQIPLHEMPVIIGEKEEILSHLSKVEGKPLTFKLAGVAPEKWKGMVLVPFSSLHECRYMVYWELVSEQDWRTRQEELERQEAERAVLEAVTIDKVTCGEQQPESDHFVQMSGSGNGDFNGRHWRIAENDGWFSYQLKNLRHDAGRLLFTYSGNGMTDAKVTINGTEAGTIAGEGGRQAIEIPEEYREEKTITVKIAPYNKERTPHFFEVRLLSPEE